MPVSLTSLLSTSLVVALTAWPPASGLSGCRGEACLAQSYEFTQVHMGMPVRIALHADSESVARKAAASAFARIETLERIFSDFRPDSELSQLNGRPGEWVNVSAELFL